MLADGRIVAAGLHNFTFPGCNSKMCEIPIEADIAKKFPTRINKVTSVLGTKTQTYFVVSTQKPTLTCDGAPDGSKVTCSGRGICRGETGQCDCPPLEDLYDFVPFIDWLPWLLRNDHCQVNEWVTILAIYGVLLLLILVPCCLVTLALCCACCLVACGGGIGTPIISGMMRFFFRIFEKITQNLENNQGTCIGFVCNRLFKSRTIKSFKEKQQFELTQSLLRTKTFEDDPNYSPGSPGDAESSIFNLDKSLFSINYDDLKDLKELDEQGGSGCLVFKATWKGEIVFVKLFKIVNRTDSKYDLEEFKREVQLMASMNHSSIVSFFGMFFAPPKRVGYVTEFCTHGNLYSIIGQKTPLKKKVQYLIQIAKGMRYLHEKGVIFRDLKCQNVLLDENWNVKLTGFYIFFVFF